MSQSAETTPGAAPEDRHARRRNRTRARLIDAARKVFAGKGIDNTRINEITEEADVGFGSFYNHFKSKEEIVEAVVVDTLHRQGEAVAAMTANLTDPAEVVSVAHRYFVERARTDPEWAWLLVHVSLSHTLGLAELGPFADRDLDRGIKSGRFRVANKHVAMIAAGGALLAVMRDVLDGSAPKDAARLHAECVLRIHGLGLDEAAEVARRRMPALSTVTR